MHSEHGPLPACNDVARTSRSRHAFRSAAGPRQNRPSGAVCCLPTSSRGSPFVSIQFAVPLKDQICTSPSSTNKPIFTFSAVYSILLQFPGLLTLVWDKLFAISSIYTPVLLQNSAVILYEITVGKSVLTKTGLGFSLESTPSTDQLHNILIKLRYLLGSRQKCHYIANRLQLLKKLNYMTGLHTVNYILP